MRSLEIKTDLLDAVARLIVPKSGATIGTRRRERDFEESLDWRLTIGLD